MNESQRDAVKNYLHNAWTLLAALNIALEQGHIDSHYLHTVEADLGRAANEWARTNKIEINA